MKEQVLYTSYLNEHDVDIHNQAITYNIAITYAKKVIIESRIKYYILANRSCIFNPFDIYNSKRSNRLFHDKDHVFKEVNKKIFDMYVRFLNSQNLSLLYNIQREVLI